MAMYAPDSTTEDSIPRIAIFGDHPDKKRVRAPDATHKTTHTLAQIHNYIVSDAKNAERQAKLRQLLIDEEIDAYSEVKGHFALGATYAGYADSGRRLKASQDFHHSGYLLIEIDPPVKSVDLETAAALRTKALELPSVAMSNISTSGSGIHTVIAVDPPPTNAKEHESAWNVCAEIVDLHFAGEGLTPDSTQDRARLAFLAHDPGAVLKNPDEVTPVKWQPIATEAAERRKAKEESAAETESTSGKRETKRKFPPDTQEQQAAAFQAAADYIRDNLPPAGGKTYQTHFLGACSAAAAFWGESAAREFANSTARGTRAADTITWHGIDTPRNPAGAMISIAKKLGYRPGTKKAARKEAVAKHRADKPSPRGIDAGFEKYDPELVGWDAIHDMTIAGRFLHQHGDRIIIAKDMSDNNPRDASVYVVLPNGRLTNRTAEIQKLLSRSSDAYLLEINTANLEGKEFGAACNHARKFKSKPAADIVRNLAEAAAGLYPTSAEILDMDEIDRDMSVIGVPGGVLDIRTRTLLPPTEARKKLVTAAALVDYNPEAKPHPHIDLVFPPGDPVAEFELAQIAFDLTHPPSRHFIAHISIGGSGKTTRRMLIQGCFGEHYIAVTRSETLQKGKGEGGGAHNSGIFRFEAPARIVFITESKEIINEILNEISGGERKLAGRQIYQAERYFWPTGTAYIQGNVPKPGETLLGLDSDSDDDAAAATRDRLIAVPFRKPEFPINAIRDKTPNDPAAMEYLMKRILDKATLMVDGDNPPEPPEEVKRQKWNLIDKETADWKKDWLPEVFLEWDEELAKDKEHFESANSHDAYQSYLLWHQLTSIGQRPASQREITNALIRRFGPPDEGIRRIYRNTISKRGEKKRTRIAPSFWSQYAIEFDDFGATV